MNPWLLLGGLGLAGLGLYYLGGKPARFLGDKAAVGDEVFVPIAAGGVGFPGVPPQAGQLVVRVQSVSGPDVLIGPVVGFALAGASPVGFVPIPPGEQLASVNRSSVTAIRRGGALVT